MHFLVYFMIVKLVQAELGFLPLASNFSISSTISVLPGQNQNLLFVAGTRLLFVSTTLNVPPSPQQASDDLGGYAVSFPLLFNCTLDGSECETVDVSCGIQLSGYYPISAAVDSVNEQLLIVVQAASSDSPMLIRCSLSGAPCTSIDVSCGLGGGCGWSPSAAVDAQGQYLFFANECPARGSLISLTRCRLDGSSCQWFDMTSGQGSRIYSPAVALDTVRRYVLASGDNVAAGSRPYVFRCSMDTPSLCTSSDVSANMGPNTGSGISVVFDIINGRVLTAFLFPNGALNTQNLMLSVCNFDATGCVAQNLSSGAGNFPAGARLFSQPLIDAPNAQVLISYSSLDALYLTRCTIEGIVCSAAQFLGGPISGFVSMATEPLSGVLLIVAASTTFQTLFQASCMGGYSGTSCLPNGCGLTSWTSTCLACPLADLSTSTCTHSNEIGSVCSARCPPSFDGVVFPSRTCLASGQWSGPAALCANASLDFSLVLASAAFPIEAGIASLAVQLQVYAGTLSCSPAASSKPFLVQVIRSQDAVVAAFCLSSSQLLLEFVCPNTQMTRPGSYVVAVNGRVAMIGNLSLISVVPGSISTNATIPKPLPPPNTLYATGSTVELGIIPVDLFGNTVSTQLCTKRLFNFSWETDFDPVMDLASESSLRQIFNASCEYSLTLSSSTNNQGGPTLLRVWAGGVELSISPILLTFKPACAFGFAPDNRSVCSLCPGGTFAAAGQGSCERCLPGTFRNESMLYCAPCARDFGPSPDSTTCLCLPSFYSFAGGCVACPRGATCSGGAAQPQSDFGFFYAGIYRNTPLFVPCPYPNACPPGNGPSSNATCAANAASNSWLCSRCLPGFYTSSGFQCRTCGRFSAPLFWVMFAAAIVVLIASLAVYIWVDEATIRPARTFASVYGYERCHIARVIMRFAFQMQRECAVFLLQLVLLGTMTYLGFGDSLQIFAAFLACVFIFCFFLTSKYLAVHHRSIVTAGHEQGSSSIAISVLDQTLAPILDDQDSVITSLSTGGEGRLVSQHRRLSGTGALLNFALTRVHVQNLVKLLVVYVQTIGAMCFAAGLLRDGAVGWLARLALHFNFQLSNIECAGVSISVRFVMYAALCPAVVFITGLLAWIRLWRIRLKARQILQEVANAREVVSCLVAQGYEQQHRRMAHVVLQRFFGLAAGVTYFFAFPLVQSALETFSCASAPGQVAWMRVAPWIRCSLRSNLQYRGLAIVAMVLLVSCAVTVSVGTVLVIQAMRKRRAGISAHDSYSIGALAFLFAPYREAVWWFEAAIFARRLALAIIVAFVSFESFMLVPLVSLVIAACVVAQFHLAPYSVKAANQIELFGLLLVWLSAIVLQLLWLAQVNQGVGPDPSTFSQIMLSLLFLAGNVGFVVVVVMAMISPLVQVLRELYRSRQLPQQPAPVASAS